MRDDACFCTAMRKATRQITAAYDAALAPADLRITQFSVLRMLQKLGPQSVTRLAETGGLDRSTMGRNLDPLEQRGLVRITEGADRRERMAHLTPDGEAAIGTALPLWKAIQKKMRAAIPPSTMSLLAALELG